MNEAPRLTECFVYDIPPYGILQTVKKHTRFEFLGSNSQCVYRLVFNYKNIQSLYGAGEGNRTLASSLGSWRSTIELHPQKLSKEYYNANLDKDQVINLLARGLPFT